jgi:predicted ATPase
MASITEVSLRNFRGFARLEKLRLAPLTFLVGPNSAGKSSIADAVLFMAQSGFLSLDRTTPVWIGPLVDLGSFKDTVSHHETTRTIEIRVGISADRGNGADASSGVDVTARLNATKDSPDGRLARMGVEFEDREVSAEMVRRRGKRELFDVRAGGQSLSTEHAWMPTALQGIFTEVVRRAQGAGGAKFFASHWGALAAIAMSIQRVSSGRSPPQRTYLRDRPTTGARPLLDGISAAALDEWQQDQREVVRDKIVEGLRVLKIADALQLARISDTLIELHMQDDITGVTSNLAEFGYGASQVIPVLEGCAVSRAGPLFVEQPEIHLHPRAQGELAQILCDASKRRQMIVETHSEHMINRARRLVAEGKMAADHVVIHYVDRDEDGSHAVTIGVDERGDFTGEWPDGFYDERYHETMKIAEAQARRGAARGRRARR